MKTKIAALLVVGAVVLVPFQASAQFCSVGIIAAAMVANFKDNRELTAKEAQTCGLLLGQDKANERPAKARAKQNPRPN